MDNQCRDGLTVTVHRGNGAHGVAAHHVELAQVRVRIAQTLLQLVVGLFLFAPAQAHALQS